MEWLEALYKALACRAADAHDRDWMIGGTGLEWKK